MRFQWIQNLPWPWHQSCQAGFEDRHFLEQKVRDLVQLQAQPETHQLDCAVQTQAQEGPSGARVEEEVAQAGQVPARHRRRHPRGHHEEEKPEARGAQGSARAGDPRRQGGQEGQGGHQEAGCRARRRCQEGRRRQAASAQGRQAEHQGPVQSARSEIKGCPKNDLRKC